MSSHLTSFEKMMTERLQGMFTALELKINNQLSIIKGRLTVSENLLEGCLGTLRMLAKLPQPTEPSVLPGSCEKTEGFTTRNKVKGQPPHTNIQSTTTLNVKGGV